MKAVFAAVLLTLLALRPAEARRARHVSLAPVPVAGAMVDDRYPNLRVPEAYATARTRQPARHRHRHHAQKRSLVRGLVAEVRKALPRGRGLTGIVPTLAAKASEIVGACHSRVISGLRHTFVAGTHRISLHAYGRAVDITGNPGCIYAHLRRWPGGYSVDYARVRHVHISYEPRGREWGARFVHGRHHHRARTLMARRHHRRG